MTNNSTATLNNVGSYTTFTFRDRTITFLTSKRLERYTEVREWNDGYLVVMAKNREEEPHEDYIDLVPILEHLRMNPETYLSDIEEVVVADE